MHFLKITFSIIPLLILTACSTVPGTGRSQLTLIPSSQMLSMSYSQYSEVIKKAKLSKDKEKTAMVPSCFPLP